MQITKVQSGKLVNGPRFEREKEKGYIKLLKTQKAVITQNEKGQGFELKEEQQELEEPALAKLTLGIDERVPGRSRGTGHTVSAAILSSTSNSS